MEIAHISDLHVGRDQGTNSATVRLASALARSSVDWVCCTGDVTHNGRELEGRAFARLFSPLRRRLTVVPGNHDRQSDDVARVLSKGPLWEQRALGGTLRLLCLDSTQPVNSVSFAAHGEVSLTTVKQVTQLIAEREEGQSLLVLVHHHLMRIAPDGMLDLLSDMQRLPFMQSLSNGEALARACVGRVACVLHGHKHKATVQHFKSLPIVNAGSTTSLGAYRVLQLTDNAVTDERWVKF